MLITVRKSFDSGRKEESLGKGVREWTICVRNSTFPFDTSQEDNDENIVTERKGKMMKREEIMICSNDSWLPEKKKGNITDSLIVYVWHEQITILSSSLPSFECSDRFGSWEGEDSWWLWSKKIISSSLLWTWIGELSSLSSPSTLIRTLPEWSFLSLLLSFGFAMYFRTAPFHSDKLH